MTKAVKPVNDDPYRNGTAFLTDDGDAVRLFHNEVGVVGSNVPTPAPMAYHSSGGRKQSPFGDRHVLGTEGMRLRTRTKMVTVR